MSFFEDLLLNIILIIFPIFFVYIYSKSMSKKCQNILLELVPVVSIILILHYTYSFSVSTYFILINIPLLFLIANDKKFGFLIISLILLYLYMMEYNFSIFWLLLEYIFYFIFFELKKNNKKIRSNKLVNYFILIKGSIITVEAIYLRPFLYNESMVLIKIFILLVVFYIVSIFIFSLIEKCYDIVSLSKVLNELEKEKEIKASLFKITHEVKNPLAVCKGYLSMINYNDIEKAKKYHKIIKQEINRTLDIMNNFSEYTKINVVFENISINDLIEDTLQSLSVLFKENKIKIEYVYSENVCINADYERLKQVLVNVIKNSIEAMGNDGVIRIVLKENKKTIDIIVMDNGKGISEDDMYKINEMFYTTKKNGSGIGVPLCREIIKLHNGKFSIYSKENVGTKIIINLPNNLQNFTKNA